MKTARIICSGRVQGVFYRASTRDMAHKLGLQGYVRNEDNGDVLIMVQGSDTAIGKLIEWCRQGPPIAKIDGVDVKWIESEEIFSDFMIRH